MSQPRRIMETEVSSRKYFMKTGQRGMYIWLMLLGVIIGAVVLAGALGSAALTAETALVLIAAYLAIVFVGLGKNLAPRLRLQAPKRPISRLRASEAARKAMQQAQHRPGYNSDILLTNVGLIINERRPDGRWDRHLARSVSMDDDAIQPYVTLNVPPEAGHRLAIIEFEFFDQTGRVQFSRKIEQWIRDGDNNIICDRQLPLSQDQTVSRSGVWDLRVSVDGGLVAIHNFSVTPSTEERRRQLNSDGEVIGDRLVIPQEDMPMSLEDLLREQRGRSER
jgi:hypothetical protein